MARALIVYSVDDPQGGATHPTLKAALADARERVEQYRLHDAGNIAHLSVSRVTIPGPFNRDLVCRLLSNGGYASSTEVVWKVAK